MHVNRLSIIVISYNTLDMTLNCLSSVFEQTSQTPFELIVWDNASQDKSAEAIGERFGNRIKLVVSDQNLGFAVANNRSAELASGDYLLLLNPDTVILAGAIDRLVEFVASQPNAGIWGGMTLFGDGQLNPASCWSKQSLWSLFCRASGLSSIFSKSNIFNTEGLGGWDREGVRSVDIVSGCFFLVRRDTWESLRGFREKYFMYGEEADFCLRAKAIGFSPIVSSEAKIIHFGGASEKIRADKLVRLIQAKMQLIDDHFPVRQKLLGFWLLSLWPLSRCVALYILFLVRLSSYEKYAVWQDVWNRRPEWWLKT
jgi:N-acetylglucosaminyl-diphospho-decaprenol L-rhamnosyltransferase